MNEKEKLIDFLNSFILVKNWEGEDSDPAFERIKDDFYIEIVESYVELIKKKYFNLYNFVDEDMNVYMSLFIRWNSLNIDDFLSKFMSLYENELGKVLKESFMLKDISEKTIKEAQISNTSKMKILYLISNLSNIKKETADSLKLAFREYERYMSIISDKYDKEIKKLEQSVESGQLNYIFTSIFNQKIMSSVDKYSFLVMSINKVMYWEGNYDNILGYSYFSMKYYFEIMNSKNIEENEVIDILKGLSDPTRYKILKSIKSGISSNKVLAKLNQVSPAAITYQLNYLQNIHLIEYDETKKTYSVNSDLIRTIVNAVKIDFSV